MTESVLLAGARTPIGRFNGGLSSLSGTDLGGIAIAEALRRAGISGDRIDYVYMGQVVMAGAGQVPARQAAVAGGIPLSVPSTALNKACPSGLNAIQQAHRMIALGEAEIVVAGGMESMTNAPYLLPQARGGYGYGNATMLDALSHDGLFCSFESVLMGASTEKDAATAQIGREEMDRVSAQSHEKAARAQRDGLFAEEIASVEIPRRKGDPIIIEDDEGIRLGTTTDSLGALRAAFTDGGNITAGNASQLSDGGAAVVVTNKEMAERLGVTPLAEIISYGEVAGPDTSLLTQPSRSTMLALDRAGMQLHDVDLFEFNEAFAAVSIASIADLGLDEDIVNVNGGAIALGHPIGMSGTRLALTLAYELKRRGGGVGAAALCGGGGQGDAMILRVG